VKTIITSLFLTILLLSAAGIVFGQDGEGTESTPRTYKQDVRFEQRGKLDRLGIEIGSFD
jgi:hypothetical protein